MPDDVRRRSVTALDIASVQQNGTASSALWQIIAPVYGPGQGHDLPPYWSRQRDYVLRSSVQREDMWQAAIGKAITMIAAQGWQVEDNVDSSLRTKRAQALLLHADDDAGWVPFVSKHLRDFLLTDNGSFVEIVRATRAAGSKILGLMHLDSSRCTRTGDPDLPVIYRDRQNREHILRDYQVLTFSDLPDPSETYNGVGLCAASRAYRTIFKLAAMELYGWEKVSGAGATGLEFIQGLSPGSLESAIDTADAAQVRKGAYYYKGKILIPIMGDVAVQVASVPLKDLPDGWDMKVERDNAYVIYANSIGIAVQDIQPLSGQGLGTGTQTVILDEAAEGQGLAAWRKQFEHAYNEYILPESTTFKFATNDIRDQRALADVQSIRATTRQTQVTSGEIDARHALQLAADVGDVPKAFLNEDMTPGGTLNDDEKPVAEDVAGSDPMVQPVLPPAAAGGDF